MLDQIIGSSWVPILQKEFDSKYMQDLSAWLRDQRVHGIKKIYPEGEDVFKALQLCPYGQVKVVIIGKDPYYQKGVADGLAFSYKNGMKHFAGKQSLDVILEEIEQDVYNGFDVNADYDLSYLAKQGVLLLNACLTVFEGSPGSHKDKGWEKFTSAIIYSQIIEPSPKVFLVWGRDAQSVLENMSPVIYEAIHSYGHTWLYAPHPASDLHNRDSFGNIIGKFPDRFTGCKHFSQVNAFLVKKDMTPINWYSTAEPFFNPPLTSAGDIINKEGYPNSWKL